MLRARVRRRVVGGLEVLKNIEQVPTDEHDRPTRPLMIAKAVVLVNPFEELDELLKKEQEFEKKRQEMMDQPAKKERSSASSGKGLSHLLDLGGDDEEDKKKEILEQLEKQVIAHSEGVGHVEKKQKKNGFGDFSSW